MLHMQGGLGWLFISFDSLDESKVVGGMRWQTQSRVFLKNWFSHEITLNLIYPKNDCALGFTAIF